MQTIALALVLGLYAQDATDIGPGDTSTTAFSDTTTITISDVEFNIRPACGCRSVEGGESTGLAALLLLAWCWRRRGR